MAGKKKQQKNTPQKPHTDKYEDKKKTKKIK